MSSVLGLVLRGSRWIRAAGGLFMFVLRYSWILLDECLGWKPERLGMESLALVLGGLG